ncbi:MAG: hypothetical protein MUE40_14680 [Anaerolineae bacterium]|jgi:hypothetical protein|nr:hypothetical protein [Anaerolineae bacterium]
MPFQLSWYVPEKVIQQDLYGDLTIEEVEQLSLALVVMLNESHAPLVHVFSDISRINSYPKNLAALQRATRPHMSHPRLGWGIILGLGSPVTRFIANTLMQMSRTRTRSLTTMAEVHAFLIEQDENLGALLPQLPAR